MDRHGNDVGNLEVLIADGASGLLVYGIVSTGFLGGAEAIAPWSVFRPGRTEDTVRLDARGRLLETSAYDPEAFSRLDKEGDLARSIHERFDRKPYWEQPWFVGAGPGRFDPLRAWQAESDYNELYAGGESAAVSGTVIAIGTFRPQPRALRGRRLRVRTPEQGVVTVHAGPRRVLERRDLRFHYGDPVTVEGRRVTFRDRRIVQARRIELEDGEVILRNEDGAPAWEPLSEPPAVEEDRESAD